MEILSGAASPSVRKITTPSKVCLICTGMFNNPNTAPHKAAHLIYLTDLNEKATSSTDDVFIKKQPTIIFEIDESSPNYELCVVGCKLYVFESCVGDSDSYRSLRDDYEGLLAFKPSKSAYTFDFSRVCDKFNIQLSKNMLTSLPDMPYPIYHPIAIPTPDFENILVFSGSFGTVLYEGVEIIDFMLYHPSTSAWTSLPGIRHLIVNANMFSFNIYVDAYAFLSPHTFFIKTRPGQMFTLDLLSLGEENNDWQVYESYVCVCDWGRFHVIQNTWFTCDSIFHVLKSGPKLNRGKGSCGGCRLGYCGCNDDVIYDSDSDSDTSTPYFMLSYPGFTSHHSSRPVTLLVDSGFCIVRTGVEMQSNFPHIIVDVFDIDGEGVGKGVGHNPFTTLKFMHDKSYDFFTPMGVFAVDY